MKVLFLCATAMLVSFAPTGRAAEPLKVPVTIGTSTSANVPTGIDVQGCTYYRLETSYNGPAVVRQICDTKSVAQLRYINRNEAINSPGSDSPK